MSNIVKTEAIVLKSMKYRETSRIVTFYTRAFGKVKAIAKGARQPKSKFGSSLEPMSFVSAVLYKKEHRDLQLLSQCDPIKLFRHLSEDLDKMAVCMSAIELINKVSHDEEKNEKLFLLLLDLLSSTNSAKGPPRNLFYAFEIHLAAILGFQPGFGKCMACEKAVLTGDGHATVGFHLGRGGPLCSSCHDQGGFKVRILLDSLRILDQLAASVSMEDVTSRALAESNREEIESLLMRFLQFHIDGLQNLKAGKVLSRILAGRTGEQSPAGESIIQENRT